MDDPIRILVVDDDPMIRSFFEDLTLEPSATIDTVASGREALDAVAETSYQLVLTDLKMPDVDGLELLRSLHRRHPETVVVVMTGQGSIKETVALMKEGAYDVLAKPFGIEEIRLAITKALKHQRICRHNEELKEKLATSEKLAIIGRLAAGVAHELNNPLDGVLRFVNLSIDRLPEENDIRSYLTEARTGLNRMADIVKSLLRFSRNIVIENEPRGIQEMVHESLAQVRHANQAGNVEVRCTYEDPELRAPAGMYQVFTNLIKNAFDAMNEQERGLLEIRAASVDGITTVEIRDNGCGIGEADLKKVFEPFYTTKQIGKGTGLGLSICARIMEKFQGTLSLESASGEGTAFAMRFPTVAADGDRRAETGTRADS